MQTLSSARRTCMALASAVECTATVLMPMSRQARWMRSAISPRLAIRIFSNIAFPISLAPIVFVLMPGELFEHHHDLAVLDRRAVLDQDLRQSSGARRADLVH